MCKRRKWHSKFCREKVSISNCDVLFCVLSSSGSFFSLFLFLRFVVGSRMRETKGKVFHSHSRVVILTSTNWHDISISPWAAHSRQFRAIDLFDFVLCGGWVKCRSRILKYAADDLLCPYLLYWNDVIQTNLCHFPLESDSVFWLV